MSITDSLNSVFGVEVETKVDKLPSDIKEIEGEFLAANKANDISFARQTLVDLINKSSDLLEESIILSKESQNPRAFETTTGLIKVMSEIAKDLIEVHSPKGQSTKQIKQDPAVTNQSQTNIYVGTTADLQKLIKDANNV